MKKEGASQWQLFVSVIVWHHFHGHWGWHHMWSRDRLMKTSSQVSRANGTTHMGLNNLQWWRRKGPLRGSCLLMWWFGITSMDMEVVGDLFHTSLVVMRQIKSQVSRVNGISHNYKGLNNLQWWRRKGLLYCSWLLVWWYGITSMDIEVVGDLFHTSFVAMRQVDEDFTSL